jgi:hypothetical protein
MIEDGLGFQLVPWQPLSKQVTLIGSETPPFRQEAGQSVLTAISYM